MVGRRKSLLLFTEELSLPGTPDTKSLEFNTSEALQEVNQTLSIANEWSILMWIKPLTAVDNREWFEVTSPGNANKIFIHTNGATDPKFQIQLYNSSATEFKRYRWSSGVFSVGTWALVVVTWDGTDLLLYVDAQEHTVSLKTIDDSGTTTNATRTTLIGGGGLDGFQGHLHSTAIFNTVLTQNSMDEIYQHRKSFDLRHNFNGYTQRDNLQHYWRHGFNASDIGEDLGFGSPKIDVGDNAINITADDIVEDAP